MSVFLRYWTILTLHYCFLVFTLFANKNTLLGFHQTSSKYFHYFRAFPGAPRLRYTFLAECYFQFHYSPRSDVWESADVLSTLPLCYERPYGELGGI